jgi:hypothetical protein
MVTAVIAWTVVANSDGLHQAIRENVDRALKLLQQYFAKQNVQQLVSWLERRLLRQEAFGKVIGCDSTNRPMARQTKDLSTKQHVRIQCCCEDVTELSKAGRPVLVNFHHLKSQLLSVCLK